MERQKKPGSNLGTWKDATWARDDEMEAQRVRAPNPVNFYIRP